MQTKTVSGDTSLASLLAAIGKELYRLRVKKGYTSHVDFAADHNLPRIQYWRMEKGKSNMTMRSLGKVVSIHGLSLEEFLGEVLKEARKRSEDLS